MDTTRLHEMSLTELYPTLRALGLAGADEELAALIRKSGGGERAVAALRREFFPAAAQEPESQPAQAPSTYPVTVDYGMTLEQMIAASRYDTRHNDITPEHFPIQGTGQVTVDLHLVHLGRDASIDAVFTELDRCNLHPATLPELLALGAKYPNLQKEYLLVALGSVWRDRCGNRRVACLDSWYGGRDLDLGWIGPVWRRPCRFVAVSK